MVFHNTKLMLNLTSKCPGSKNRTETGNLKQDLKYVNCFEPVLHLVLVPQLVILEKYLKSISWKKYHWLLVILATHTFDYL